MAYFGDSLAHCALLGVAIGIILNIPNNAAIIIVSLFFVAILLYLQNKNTLSIDALLGILAHGALSIAVILMSFSKNPDTDLESLLFGDISSIVLVDLFAILCTLALVFFFILKNWQKLVLFTINEEIASTKGINKNYMRFLIIFSIAITVAVSIKIVGALLITSLLIIPAATARQFANSTKLMAVLSVIFASLASLGGIIIVNYHHLPTGAVIIILSIILFSISLALKKLYFS